MGRATEFFDYINRPKKPSKADLPFLYCSLTITDEIEKIRKKIQKERKKQDAN